MNAFTIIAFYKFFVLPNFAELREPFLAKMQELNIKGTLILAEEGANGSFCGDSCAVAKMISYLQSFSGFEDINFRATFDEANPFKKAKVKLRTEIVSFGCENIDPTEVTGEHLSPEIWNNLIAKEDVVLIDTRNDYEVVLGSFEGAINPKTENFRDFPEYVEKHLLDKKDKKIAMFCTGGIRCEKSTAYLKKLGFANVYQLDGGILNYLATIPEQESKWQGGCFVFDDRVALDKNLQSFTKGSIDNEWKNNHKKASKTRDNA